MCWSGLQPSVKRLGWKNQHLQIRGHGSRPEKGGVPSPGGLVQRPQSAMSVYRFNRRGEEGAESKGSSRFTGQSTFPPSPMVVMNFGRVPPGEGPVWKTQDTLERLCLSAAGLGTPWDPPGRAGGSVWGEGSLGISAQTAASATRSRTKRMKMDGWMEFLTWTINPIPNSL
ncbi:hypothetical protein L3Q82_012210, partial [Scortum barcoo]